MSLDEHVHTLKHNPALADLEPDALRLIAFSAETRILRAGDVIFRRNDVSDGGVFVVSGSISLDSGSATTVLGPGTLLGELAMLTDVRRTATAIAREPSSVLKISRTLFHRVLDEFPASAERLQRVHQGRVADLGRELDDLRSPEG